MDLGERHLFATDHVVDPVDQAELIRIARREGIAFRGMHTAPEVRPYWKWVGLAEPAPRGIPESGRRWLATDPHARYLSRWGYYARLDPNVPWTWTSSKTIPVVQRILAPVLPLYRRLTKVNIILQVPGEPIGAHRDLAHGNSYDLESPYHWASGPERLRYEGESWLNNVAPIHNASHEENLYLCLKIPLSERPEDAGNPFVELEETRYYYTSRNRLFFLNEVEILHGADPAPFWRGVVFVNGILNTDEVRRMPKTPIDVLRTSRVPTRSPVPAGAITSGHAK